MGGEPSTNLAIGAFGGAPHGAAKRARGVPTWAGDFGGAPYVATTRARGVPTWAGKRMRTLPRGRSVELTMGTRRV
eukprot:2590057-Pyramimonas_sp.AAC.1